MLLAAPLRFKAVVTLKAAVPAAADDVTGCSVAAPLNVKVPMFIGVARLIVPLPPLASVFVPEIGNRNCIERRCAVDGALGESDRGRNGSRGRGNKLRWSGNTSDTDSTRIVDRCRAAQDDCTVVERSCTGVRVRAIGRSSGAASQRGCSAAIKRHPAAYVGHQANRADRRRSRCSATGEGSRKDVSEVVPRTWIRDGDAGDFAGGWVDIGNGGCTYAAAAR